MSEQIEKHILNQYKVIDKIGSGAYGHVFKVTSHGDQKTKALKKNFDAFNNSTDAQRTYRQIMFLLELNHPNIINLQHIIRAENDKDIYLVFEYMDIDLYTLIRENILAQKHKKYILYQVVKAIYYLHSAALIHRDIKPSNILVNENCTSKLCDFGLVRSVDDQTAPQDQILTQYIATRWYRAPEILLGSKSYSKAIDIWSIGCLLGQMMKGKPLFPGTSTINQLERVLMWTGPLTRSEIESLNVKTSRQILHIISKVKKMNRNQIFPNISPQCLDLITKTLQFDPQKRIKIEQVLTHPYFKQFYNPLQIIKSQTKIKIGIDDNRRLLLKDYRQLIYQQIKNRNKNTNQNKYNIADSTFYRIRDKPQKTIRAQSEQTVKDQGRGIQKNSKTVSIKRTMNASKQKSFGKVDSLYSKKLKTVGNDWDYIESKKVVILKQEHNNPNNFMGKKKSITQTDNRRNVKLHPTIRSFVSKKL